jgi:hypothetical protein
VDMFSKPRIAEKRVWDAMLGNLHGRGLDLQPRPPANACSVKPCWQSAGGSLAGHHSTCQLAISN